MYELNLLRFLYKSEIVNLLNPSYNMKYRKVIWILQDAQINLFLKVYQLLHKELLSFWHGQALGHHNQHRIF